MSEVLASAEDAQITECEEFALCHGEGTRKKAYTTQKVKKSKAVMATNWYKKAFAPGEASMVMDAETTKKVTERAKERLDEERLHKLRKAEVAAAENFTAMQRADGRAGASPLKPDKDWTFCSHPRIFEE